MTSRAGSPYATTPSSCSPSHTWPKRTFFEQRVWARRDLNALHPAWLLGDSNNANNPGLMTGTAGVGWFYLQLATEGRVPGPIPD
jgi:hypothetical protein